MPKAAGKWNTYEITAQGPHLVVVLNGQKTADVQDSKHAERPDRAAIRFGRGQIPQGADQAAVRGDLASRTRCGALHGAPQSWVPASLARPVTVGPFAATRPH